MKTRFIALLVMSVAATVAEAQNFDGGPGEWMSSSWFMRRDVELTAITNTNVVDVVTGDVLEGVTIAFWGDEIEVVGEGIEMFGGDTVDGSELWIIPGLIDLHAHVIPPSRFFPDSPPPEETLRILLDHGVTTIRALPFFSESGHVWKARVDAGLLDGPTMVVSSGIFEQEAQRTSVGFEEPEYARAWVEKEALLGSRWIKVYNSMDEPSLAAIVSAASRHGMRVCGHAEGVPPKRAAEIGQATIEHAIDIPSSCLRDDAVELEDGDFYDKVTWGWKNFDPEKGDELLRVFLERGTGWVPTLVVQDRIAEVGHDLADPPTPEKAADIRTALKQAAELAVKFHRMGGLVGLGTDFPVDGVAPGDSVHRELELFVEAGGATPLEALRIATRDSARILGHGELLGTVESGKLANLVALRANPLDDISNTRDIAFVVHDGRVRDFR